MVLVSACLLGKCCRYNGGHSKNQNVLAYIKERYYISVCPEVLGGLETPRHPAEIIGGTGKEVIEGTAKVCNNLGQDVTAAFLAGAHMVVELAQRNNATEVILKENSPSCGVYSIYDGSFSGKKIFGSGVCAELLKELPLVLMNEDLVTFAQ